MRQGASTMRPTLSTRTSRQGRPSREMVEFRERVHVNVIDRMVGWKASSCRLTHRVCLGFAGGHSPSRAESIGAAKLMRDCMPCGERSILCAKPNTHALAMRVAHLAHCPWLVFCNLILLRRSIRFECLTLFPSSSFRFISFLLSYSLRPARAAPGTRSSLRPPTPRWSP
jgi:hypothetical protein